MVCMLSAAQFDYLTTFESVLDAGRLLSTIFRHGCDHKNQMRLQRTINGTVRAVDQAKKLLEQTPAPPVFGITCQTHINQDAIQPISNSNRHPNRSHQLRFGCWTAKVETRFSFPRLNANLLLEERY
jgi:hypothetical protein